jgi:hypothetical protein
VAKEDPDVAVAVSLFGMVIIVMGVLGLAAPSQFVGAAARWRVSSHLPSVVALRTVVGVFLLLAGRYCRYSSLVRAVGVLTLIAAGALLLVGRSRFEHFMARWLERPPWHTRLLSLAAFVFGGVLIWAAGWPW